MNDDPFDFSVVQRLAGPLRHLLPQRPDALEAVRLQLALWELQKARNGGILRVEAVPMESLLTDRVDMVFLGRRGAGKTAAACTVAQAVARTNGQAVYAWGAPRPFCEAMGFVPIDGLEGLRDAIVIADEAGMRVRAGRRDDVLFEAVALARQKGLSLLWTAQSMASVHRDVLRQDVRPVWMAVDPFAARFDREEVADLIAQVVSVQGPDWPIGAGVTPWRHGWATVDFPLPAGWSDATSRLWR